MRIHSDKITLADIFFAAGQANATVHDVSQHGSRSRRHAFKFYLTGDSPSRPNQRDYGPDDYAASWDQWGVVIGHLYAIDPDAHFGKHSYRGAEDFHFKTGYRFVPGFLRPSDLHRRHKWAPDYAGAAYCDCGAVHRWDTLPELQDRVRSAINGAA